ncbi:hypothetical protein [Bradyrhizobium elkanii]|uniref:hypothetical protein n=1 Tax=Bradyrhizobium elkanii TaxID=29448 RepID=UPI0034E42D3F
MDSVGCGPSVPAVTAVHRHALALPQARGCAAGRVRCTRGVTHVHVRTTMRESQLLGVQA